jgi:hypothetical protein
VDIGCKLFDTLLQEENRDSIYKYSNNIVLKKDDAVDNANSREDESYELLNVKIRFMPPDCLSREDPFVKRLRRFRAITNLSKVYSEVAKQLPEGSLRKYVQVRSQCIQKDSLMSIPSSESEDTHI